MEENINAALTIEAGEGQGKTCRLDQNTLSLGRGHAEGNRITFSSQLISHQHAEIRCFGGRFILQDLGSRNGTWVNGESLEAKADYCLKDNDVVDLARGAAVLRFYQSERTVQIGDDELRKLTAPPQSAVNIFFNDSCR